MSMAANGINGRDESEFIRSAQYVAARRRVFRQLIEALIYEQMVPVDAVRQGDGLNRYTIVGQAADGASVDYCCEGRQMLAFGRIRLSADKPIIRVQGEDRREVDDLAVFLEEIHSAWVEEPRHLERFIYELEQTLLKEAAARYHVHLNRHTGQRSYDELEGDVLEAHPYHPCFKSRIGFDLEDNAAYGPEFNPQFKLMWLAVHKDLVVVATSSMISFTAFIRNELGPQTVKRFTDLLIGKGAVETEYVFIPVHPWQWRNKVIGAYFRYIESGQIIPLGEGDDEYSPQQSIRTLSNRTDKQKWNVKAPISITNTSAVRILGTHHVTNAPILSDWLAAIVEQDPYLRQELGLVILKEAVAVSFRYGLLPEPVKAAAYGSLGAIWRENIQHFLADGEEAVPFTALCHIKADGVPFIHEWVTRHGVVEWINGLFRSSIVPLIHLLFAHGVAMESHGQNMALIHRDGVPARIALKDLPGGVRFYKRSEGDSLRTDLLRDSDPEHPNSYSTSPMETEAVSKIRNFLLDSFFQINLAEIGWVLERYYGVSETAFWSLAAEQITAYQQQFPMHEEAFKKYDLFVPAIDVGQLTRRRLFGEHVMRNHAVRNPLYWLKHIEEGKQGDPVRLENA
jgi:siderophore synthetase component